MKRPERTRRVFRMAPRLFLIAALALAPAACNWGGRGRPEPIRFAPKTAAAIVQIRTEALRGNETWAKGLREALETAKREGGLGPGEYVDAVLLDPGRSLRSLTVSVEQDPDRRDSSKELYIFDIAMTLEELQTLVRLESRGAVEAREFKAGPLTGLAFTIPGAASEAASETERDSRESWDDAPTRDRTRETAYVIRMDGYLIGSTSEAALLRGIHARVAKTSAAGWGYYREKMKAMNRAAQLVFIANGSNFDPRLPSPRWLASGGKFEGAFGWLQMRQNGLDAEFTAEFTLNSDAKDLFDQLNSIKALLLLSRGTQPLAKGLTVRLEGQSVRVSLALDNKDLTGAGGPPALQRLLGY